MYNTALLSTLYITFIWFLSWLLKRSIIWLNWAPPLLTFTTYLCSQIDLIISYSMNTCSDIVDTTESKWDIISVVTTHRVQEWIQVLTEQLIKKQCKDINYTFSALLTVYVYACVHTHILLFLHLYSMLDLLTGIIFFIFYIGKCAACPLALY